MSEYYVFPARAGMNRPAADRHVVYECSPRGRGWTRANREGFVFPARAGMNRNSVAVPPCQLATCSPRGRG